MKLEISDNKDQRLNNVNFALRQNNQICSLFFVNYFFIYRGDNYERMYQ